MLSSDLPKLWTDLTKIGHTFRIQSTLKIKVFENFIHKSWSSSYINILHRKERNVLIIMLSDLNLNFKEYQGYRLPCLLTHDDNFREP